MSGRKNLSLAISRVCRTCGNSFNTFVKSTKEYCKTSCRPSAIRIYNNKAKAIDIDCTICQKRFTTTRSQSKYCSDSCRKVAYTGSLESMDLQGSTGSIGAYKELLVSLCLMKLGFSVYRALSPSAPCDLVATRGDTILRIEVTTGYPTRTGRVNYALHDPSRYDVICVVLNDDTVKFYPELPI